MKMFKGICKYFLLLLLRIHRQFFEKKKLLFLSATLSPRIYADSNRVPGTEIKNVSEE
jgi:hypothetical protein